MTVELPAGWSQVPLGALGNWYGGGTPSKAVPAYWSRGTIPWVSPKDMKVPRIRVTEDYITLEAVQESSTKIVPLGAILIVTRSGILEHSLPIALADVEVALNQDLKALSPTIGVDSEYVSYALQAESQRILTECRKAGTTVASINYEALREYCIPLAPLNEQRRIVAKIEALMERSRRAKAALDAIPPLLEQLRQSVLAAAFRGDLTADWNESSSIPMENSDSYLSCMPLIRVENILPKGGIFDGPFGSNLKTSDYTNCGVRVIRLENIGQLCFLADKQTFISQEKYQTLSRHQVKEKDVIFSSFVSDDVRACVLPKLDTLAIAKADCFCLRPDPRLLSPQYLCYMLSAPQCYRQVVRLAHGATRVRVNTTEVKSLLIPNCSIAVQNEIVRQIDLILSSIRKLHNRYEGLRSQILRLDSSILDKAFQGELVPQDPDDEPASVLLERIQEERRKAEAAGGKKSGGKRRGRGQSGEQLSLVPETADGLQISATEQ